jgi:hypothetical protein
MPGYDPSRPFRVWYSQAVGVAPGSRGPEVKAGSYATLVEARAAAKSLPAGFIRITDGPDHQLIEYRLEPYERPPQG